MNRLLAAFAAGLAAFGLSCGDEDVVCENPPLYPMTEPKYVLANVALAFNNPDPTFLGQVLDADFVFYFNPGDVGAELTTGYVIPASWGRREFIRAAEKLITSAKSVSFKCPWDTIGTPGAGVSEYEARTVLVFVVRVDDTRYYRAKGSYGYVFLKTPGVNWQLTAWRDYASYHYVNGGEPNLGRILALYYE
ncbi:MAG TPA: hypothetical protein VMW93_06815 [bacterium]|nr:hypothetical protein [bacterium]